MRVCAGVCVQVFVYVYRCAVMCGFAGICVRLFVCGDAHAELCVRAFVLIEIVL